MIIVIVPAYKAQDFIEECLDSISSNEIPHEIYLGIDGCKETLDKVNTIKHKYNNLSVFYFENNAGCYVTLNTLVSLTPDDCYIQVFGADDVMNKDMLRKMYDKKPCFSMYTGISMLHKTHYEKLGGYMPWRVAADTDFAYRLMKIEPEFKMLKKLFFRREHEQQLTKSKDLGLGTETRNEYVKHIKKVRKNKDFYVQRVIHREIETIW